MGQENQTPVDPPELHAPHAGHTGHRRLDILLGLTAVLVSAVSLYVAIDNGKSMQRLVAANSWPSLEIGAIVNESTTLKLMITIQNNGVGPARLETVELWGGATPLTDANAIAAWIKRLGGGEPFSAHVDGSSVTGAVIGAGKDASLIAFTIDKNVEAWSKPMLAAAGLLQTRICYCSVFDECYVSDSRIARGRPVAAGHCPVAPAPYNDDISVVVGTDRSAKGSP